MKNIIDLVTTNTPEAAPYIRIGTEGNYLGKYLLVGKSDLATSADVDYGEYGKCKLTARNHVKTLNALMNFLLFVDEIDSKGMLDFENPEIILLINWMLGFVMDSFFGRDDTVATEEGMGISDLYPEWVIERFLVNNPQMVNEALYNVTMDAESRETIDKAMKSQDAKAESWEKLDGQQFSDPYISIAYNIAKEFSMQPSKVINEWSTAELIVMFASVSNEKSLSAFGQYQVNKQKKQKSKAPDKQKWFFDEITNGDASDE